MGWKQLSPLCLAALLAAAVYAAESKKDSAGSTDTRPAEATAAEKPNNGFPADAGSGIAAVRQAAKHNKHLFVMFYRGDDNQTRSMRKVLDKVTQKASDKAESVSINIADPQEKPIVTKLDVSRAPMPLTLVLAPNGAITGGFPKQADESKLVSSIVGPSTAACLKALQDKKYVLLCIQNKNTQSNAAAMEGVNAFKADARYAKVTEIVTADPTNTDDAKLLKDVQVDAQSKEAATVFLAPPGNLVGRFAGATNKAALVAVLEKAKSGSGCSGGKGCCPGK